MTGPQEKTRPSGCGTVAQPDYCAQQMAHLKEQTSLQLKALETAHDKYVAILDERLGRMNEFREAMRDQASRFIDRGELDLKLAAMDKDIKALQDFAAEHRGKASNASVVIATLLSVAALVIGLISVLR